MRTIALLSTCLLSLSCAGRPAAVSAGDVDLLPNGSFENPGKDGPALWHASTWGGKGAHTVEKVGRGGSQCAVLSIQEGGDVSWTATAALEPYSKYRLSGWIRTENVESKGGKGALLNLHNIQPLATAAVTGTKDWTRVELVFESGERDAVQVNCTLGAWGFATGKAWYDDLRLEKIGATGPWSPKISVDAAKTGEPLSKYVYGQFIEHLGRCIYGGIWAEMLEDRKFFWAVGKDASPWKAQGPEGSVAMVKEGAFVGEHTPQVALAAGERRGIVQKGLGLRKGKEYVGRIWLAGPVEGSVEVSLVWGEGADGRQTVKIGKVGAEFGKTPLRFSASADTDDGRLEIVSSGTGTLRIGTAALMPADNVKGMRPDTLALLKELDAPVYRWPGGNFVSGYNWKDGIGDQDRRPPRKNPAWTGVEHNDFGIDEFMEFCRELGTDPYIAVNSGMGDATSAVEEVQYANGAPDTAQGKLRAANGHPEAYGVRFWSIGNEMYGGWQLGHMPLEQYVKKHNAFAEAMRAVDPKVQLIAVGDAGPWSAGMMRNCADHMELISEHFYCQEDPGLYGHVSQIPRAIRAKAEAHRRYRKDLDALKGKDIRIAMDEWNYWYGPHVFGELGTRYFLKDGLGIAAGINEYARQSDMVFMANYAQTVNVIGCIKTTKTDAAFETTGLVLKLYRKSFGTIPAATEASPLLSAQAAWTADRKALTLSVVNSTMKAAEVALDIQGAKLTGSGVKWQIAGPDPMAFNDPGKPARVAIEESPVTAVKDKLVLAPCSVTLLRLDSE